jgi:uncharacterized protein (DUF779 family)
MVPEQVITTSAAVELMAMLQAKHGELMFHQSGGCCDGSSPMCYPRGEFLVGDSDVLLATLDGTPFYMSRSQFEYWKHTRRARGGAVSYPVARLYGWGDCGSASIWANLVCRGAQNDEQNTGISGSPVCPFRRSAS